MKKRSEYDILRLETLSEDVEDSILKVFEDVYAGSQNKEKSWFCGSCGYDWEKRKNGNPAICPRCKAGMIFSFEECIGEVHKRKPKWKRGMSVVPDLK